MATYPKFNWEWKEGSRWGDLRRLDTPDDRLAAYAGRFIQEFRRVHGQDVPPLLMAQALLQYTWIDTDFHPDTNTLDNPVEKYRIPF